jgi:hypothetical protein
MNYLIAKRPSAKRRHTDSQSSVKTLSLQSAVMLDSAQMPGIVSFSLPVELIHKGTLVRLTLVSCRQHTIKKESAISVARSSAISQAE